MAQGDRPHFVLGEIMPLRLSLVRTIAALVLLTIPLGKIAFAQERSLTHNSPITAGKEDSLESSAVVMLRALPPLSSLHGNGLRYVVMAHMIGGYFGFAISDSGSDQATGVFLTYGIYGETVVRRRTLSSSAAAYNKLVQDLDAMQAGYWKDTTGCVDGAPIAFERVSGTVVRSGIGNCSDHYEKVGMRIYEFLASETNQKELFGPDGWRLR